MVRTALLTLVLALAAQGGPLSDFTHVFSWAADSVDAGNNWDPWGEGGNASNADPDGMPAWDPWG